MTCTFTTLSRTFGATLPSSQGIRARLRERTWGSRLRATVPMWPFCLAALVVRAWPHAAVHVRDAADAVSRQPVCRRVRCLSLRSRPVLRCPASRAGSRWRMPSAGTGRVRADVLDTTHVSRCSVCWQLMGRPGTISGPSTRQPSSGRATRAPTCRALGPRNAIPWRLTPSIRTLSSSLGECHRRVSGCVCALRKLHTIAAGLCAFCHILC